VTVAVIAIAVHYKKKKIIILNNVAVLVTSSSTRQLRVANCSGA
jgi:hypothetical protein